MDPTTWISYKVTLNPVLVEIASHLSHKFLRPSLTDTEKTCFGMADACIAGGSAGCRLMNFIGDNGDRNDIAALLNGAHDVISFRLGLINPTDSISTLAGPQTLSHGDCGPRSPWRYEGYGPWSLFHGVWSLTSQQKSFLASCALRRRGPRLVTAPFTILFVLSIKLP